MFAAHADGRSRSSNANARCVCSPAPRNAARLVAMLVVLALASWSQAQPPHSVTAVRTATPPVIDGVIQPGEWAKAARVDNFIQLQPRRGAPATERTVAYILYDDLHIYVGVYAYDSEPGKITARLTRRDADMADDDSITIFLDTFHDRRNCYLFATNPLGTQTDGRIGEDGRVRDTTWDAEWSSASRITADGWSAEFAIPFRVLQFRPGKNRTWGFNIGRTRRANLEASFWAGPLEAAFRVSQYGELRGLDLTVKGAKRWELVPYLLGNYAQGRNTKGDAGLDFRYTFSPETRADVTVNPDFATVEADEEFVNLTRFEPQLREKRPFFLESNDRFRQRIQSFYSRRIQDIDIGGTLRSRYGAWDMTLLSVRSSPMEVDSTLEDGSVLEHANYTVARVQRHIMKSSDVGILVANRALGGENRGSVGLDTTLHLTRIMNFTGQLVRSHGPYTSGRWAFFVRPAWDSSTFHYHFRYTHLGDRFGDNVNAIGFVRDDNRREMDSDLEKVFWLEKGPIQRIGFEAKNNIYWSQQNVLRHYHQIDTAEVEFRNRWSVEAGHGQMFDRFEKKFFNNRTWCNLGYNTREYNSWEIEYQTGRNYDSDLDSMSARIRRKVSQKLGVEYQLSRVWLNPDPENKATLINIFRARHNFTRDVYLRLFFQTNSVIDRKNLEAVFVWRYQPPFGSIQFAFQRGRAAFGQRSQQGNTFFVKMTHVF